VTALEADMWMGQVQQKAGSDWMPIHLRHGKPQGHA